MLFKQHKYNTGQLVKLIAPHYLRGICLYVTACLYDIEGNPFYCLGPKRKNNTRMLCEYFDISDIQESQIIPVKMAWVWELLHRATIDLCLVRAKINTAIEQEALEAKPNCAVSLPPVYNDQDAQPW